MAININSDSYNNGKIVNILMLSPIIKHYRAHYYNIRDSFTVSSNVLDSRCTLVSRGALEPAIGSGDI